MVELYGLVIACAELAVITLCLAWSEKRNSP